MEDDETLKKTKWVLAFLLLILLLRTLLIRSTESASCVFEWEHQLCDDSNPINGYWSHDRNVWVPGYINNKTWLTPAPYWFTGRAVYYAPWIMEATAKWRGLSLDGYVDGVSLMSPADVGIDVWIRIRGEWEGPFLVVDCARRGDMWPIIVKQSEAVEVGYRTALRWGTLQSPWPRVEVSKINPRFLTGTPISYRLWFESRVQFSDHIEPRVLWRYPNEWLINGKWEVLIKPLVIRDLIYWE